MKLNVEIKGAKLNLKGKLSEENVSNVITGFFNTLDDSKGKQLEKAVDSLVDVKAKTSKYVEAAHPTPEIPVSEIVPQQPSKVVEKIGEERTLAVPIAEALASKEGTPEYWVTGIKVEDGIERYRTFYTCDCGSKGKRYIERDKEFIECRDCGAALVVEDATLEKQKNGLPVRDSWGNFFIAREVVGSK